MARKAFGVLGAAALASAVSSCASRGPAYEREILVTPRSRSVDFFVEEQLTEQGYEVLERIERSFSLTLSALKIRPGRDPNVILYDWLHVTISRPTAPSGAGDPRFVVGVRAESAEEDRERRRVPPSVVVVADANRLLEYLRTAR